MPRELAVAIASAPRIRVAGQFQRHVSPKSRGLTGSTSGGRWGPPRAFSVLYLGRPRNSVVVEAYRHLVDPFAAEGMTGDMISPRRLLTCEVDVTDVLDLISDEGQAAVGLEDDDLASSVGEWGPCQHVARVAHQLGVHGILAPAATRMGETLALFEQHLDEGELPVLIEEETWDRLPGDPREFRLIEGEGSS